MDPLAPLIDNLHREGRLRVWSLVITAFGDLVQHRGGEIASIRLGQLLGRVGVEPGAMRTALSRLGRDGWVDSRRVGRSSFYKLSHQGLDQFGPATSRIYAPPRTKRVTRWAISIALQPDGEPRVALAPEDQEQTTGDLRLVGTLEQLSDRYRAGQLEPAHRAALEALAIDLTALEGHDVQMIDAAAARLLLIHRWRRIVLRFPEIVHELLPRDCPLSNPRHSVADTYARLSVGAESWLDNSMDGVCPMPAADETFAQRFSLPKKA